MVGSLVVADGAAGVVLGGDGAEVGAVGHYGITLGDDAACTSGGGAEAGVGVADFAEVGAAGDDGLVA